MAGRTKLPSKARINEEKLKAPITFQLLERILAYLVFYRPLDMNLVISIKNLFDNLSDESLSTFEDRKLRADMIRLALTAILDSKIHDKDLIIDYIVGSISDVDACNSAIEGIEEQIPSEGEEITEDSIFSEYNVEYIAKRITNLLQYNTLYRHKDQLGEIIQKVNSGDIGSLKTIAHDFSDLTQRMNADIQKSEAAILQQRSYIFGTDSYKNSLNRTLTDQKKPSAYLHTGIRELDKILGGGFRSEKVYVFLGAPGTGKSVFLLNILKWMMLYNPRMEAKNPALKPLVLFVSQENSVSETDERHYSVAAPDIANEVPFKDQDTDDLVNLYAERGWGTTGKITYAMEYRGNKEISTRDLDAMCDSYAREGYEVVMIIHDYVKRIRPAISVNDLRIDLGEVINDECNIAKKRKIPIVTVMQVNREAVSKIEDAKNSNKPLDKCITAANIGESMMIYENCDYCGALLPYLNPINNKRYLCFLKLKSRYKIDYKGEFLALPYEPDSISLETNFGKTESGVLTSLGDGLAGHVPASSSGKKVPSARNPLPSSRGTETKDSTDL